MDWYVRIYSEGIGMKMLKKLLFNYKFDIKKFKLGMRIFKIGLLVFLVLLVFYLFGWKGF